jgi:catechol 2,3-dioxygenase-like lactoylglutathione lyase family enzyme
MTLFLDHTIVPSHDKVESAKFIARMFGLTYDGPWGPFAPVKFNDTLSMDFDDRREVNRHHYAFLASDQEFDEILGRVKAEKVAFGSGPQSTEDGEINHLHTGRGFYFKDANGHSWEVITHTYI